MHAVTRLVFCAINPSRTARASCGALKAQQSLFCSFVQAQAAAQAGVSVIQPNVGRIMDWYKKHPGYIKNQKVSLCFCSSSM